MQSFQAISLFDKNSKSKFYTSCNYKSLFPKPFFTMSYNGGVCGIGHYEAHHFQAIDTFIKLTIFRLTAYCPMTYTHCCAIVGFGVIPANRPKCYLATQHGQDISRSRLRHIFFRPTPVATLTSKCTLRFPVGRKGAYLAERSPQKPKARRKCALRPARVKSALTLPVRWGTFPFFNLCQLFSTLPTVVAARPVWLAKFAEPILYIFPIQNPNLIVQANRRHVKHNATAP